MKVGDRVVNIFTRRTGVVLDVWDGKYRTDYYGGEQYNPYRITVKIDGKTKENSIGNFKKEQLEIVKEKQDNG